MEKEKYEALKDIKTRIAKGQPTTFAERNIVKIHDKKMRKKTESEVLEFFSEKGVKAVKDSILGKNKK
jgi:hypothetical protein